MYEFVLCVYTYTYEGVCVYAYVLLFFAGRWPEHKHFIALLLMHMTTNLKLVNACFIFFKLLDH